MGVALPLPLLHGPSLFFVLRVSLSSMLLFPTDPAGVSHALQHSQRCPSTTVPQGPPFRHCCTHVPMGSSSLSPPTPPQSPPSGCSSGPGLLCGGTHGLCPLQGDGDPLLHCSLLHGCTGRSALQGAHVLQGQPAPPTFAHASKIYSCSCSMADIAIWKSWSLSKWRSLHAV